MNVIILQKGDHDIMKIICSECGRVIDYGIYKTKLKEKVITSYDICKKCKRKLSDGGKND